VTTFGVFSKIVLLVEFFLICSCHSANPSNRQPAVERATSSSPSHQLIRYVDGRTIEGKPILFDFEHQKNGTLLFVMSPSCPFCRINFHNWRSLLIPPVHTAVIWVDISDSATAEYRAVFGLNQKDAMVKISQDKNKLFPFWTTPTTALITPDGHVEWSHEGVLTSADVAWLKNKLKVEGGE
jgi:hypothetical protein